MAKKKIVRIPGVSFSWKRALGITQAKQKFARQTEIPTSKEKALHWLDGCRSLGEP